MGAPNLRHIAIGLQCLAISCPIDQLGKPTAIQLMLLAPASGAPSGVKRVVNYEQQRK